ncbi:hypothetical protein E1B28_013654 [Marasmius oreades]|uniref:HAT C-terminal dimerisation domain-containing protein n=1 Tax=Marasmius oreades TaxID=181124 RepID=A0A9P7UMG1_9AGAR|nr:uncharacterized protein E1B28_013654 [Marasmius oreades]KAG7087707.1 hypothetical protein E1B28_013654 [Marasmius oreades]
MALNYLPIQGSSIPSEQLFSGCGLTDTKLWNQLNPATLEAIQVLKDAYSSGMLKPIVEAAEWQPIFWVPPASSSTSSLT